MIFRELNEQEQREFRAWARANYKRGQPIEASWHPVVQEECRIMDREPPEDSRTLAQLAREALDVQNACNLSGVAQGFARSILRLRRLLEAEGQGGTKATNEHPICQLWADKIAHLTGTQFSVSWAGRAYDAVHGMAEQGREVSRAS